MSVYLIDSIAENLSTLLAYMQIYFEVSEEAAQMWEEIVCYEKRKSNNKKRYYPAHTMEKLIRSRYELLKVENSLKMKCFWEEKSEDRFNCKIMVNYCSRFVTKKEEKDCMQIYAHERGNSYGCTYFISFYDEELVITLVWEDNFFTYNKEEIESRLNKMKVFSTSIKLAIYQFIEKTNYLLYLSYKELH